MSRRAALLLPRIDLAGIVHEPDVSALTFDASQPPGRTAAHDGAIRRIPVNEAVRCDDALSPDTRTHANDALAPDIAAVADFDGTRAPRKKAA